MRVRGIFIERLREFLALHGLGRSEFGTLALKDRKFVLHVEKGMPITLSRIEAAEDFMARVAADPALLDRLRNGDGPADLEPVGVGGNP